MWIINEDKKRFLIKKDQTKINVSDNKIVKYNANYYKSSFDFKEETFIGEIQCPKISDYITVGLYIKPLYIFIDNEWHQIINYKDPEYKYFLYPHLLCKPNFYYQYSNQTLETIDDSFDFELEFDPDQEYKIFELKFSF